LFEETDNRTNFQGRYVLRHPYKGAVSCPAGDAYRRELANRFEREAQSLANLTGWQIADIRKRMGASGQPIERIRDDDPEWTSVASR